MSQEINVACCTCRRPIVMTSEVNETLRQSHINFYCLFGHPNHYPAGKTRTQELEEKLEAERRERQRVEQRVAEKADEARAAWATATEQRQRAEHERRRANGYKGHATRITKRAKAGVCPCCNRTFQQLARHMATQHPQFTPMTLEVIDGGKEVVNG